MQIKKILIFFTVCFFKLFYFYNANAETEKFLDAFEILQRSENAFKIILNNEDLNNFESYFNNAKAVIIFPEIYEGGLFFGAKGGNGLLMIRKNGSWSGPFFYTIGGVSLGIQFGLKTGKVIFTIMTEKGLESVLKERVKFGVDIDAAVANQGVGYSAESTVRLADVYSFSDNSGLFIGGSFEGTYLQPRNDFNLAFHNKKFNSDDIFYNKTLHPKATNLVKILKKY